MSKLIILPQDGKLFRKDGQDGPNAAPYTVILQDTQGTKRTYGNRPVTQYGRAYIRLTESGLIDLFEQCGLVDEAGKPVSDVKALAKGQYQAHKDAGYNEFQLVQTESIEPQYEGQLPAGNDRTKKIYTDAEGKPVFRSAQVLPIDGYKVVVDGNEVFNSQDEMDIYIESYNAAITDELPAQQALKRALEEARSHKGARLVMITTGRDGVMEMPKSTSVIKGSRAMTDAELAERAAVRAQAASGQPRNAAANAPAGTPAPQAEVPAPQAATAVPEGQEAALPTT